MLLSPLSVLLSVSLQRVHGNPGKNRPSRNNSKPNHSQNSLQFLTLALNLQQGLAQIALDAGRRNLGDAVDPTSEGDGVVGVAVGPAGGVSTSS